MSLLSICQNACDEVGLKRPATIIGNLEPTAKRCLRYAERIGREFVREGLDLLTDEHTFSTVNGTADYALPDDFDHFVPFTHWNRTTDRQMHPIQPKEWQLYKSGLVDAQINDRFRIKGRAGQLSLHPTPTSAETIAYEYVSKNFCESQGGTPQSSWQADTDVGLSTAVEQFEGYEDLFELGIVWRLLNRLGEPYAEEKAEYQRILNTHKAQVAPQKVSMDGHYPATSNIPDANFPAT